MAEEAVLLKRKKKKDDDGGEEEGPDRDAWMVTFSDLLQLLITFFVLLISMSSMDTKVFKEMFAVFTGGIGELYMTASTRIHQPDVVPSPESRVEVDAFKKLLRLDPASTQYEQELESIIESLLVSGVEVLPGTNEFKIRLSEAALFKPGQVTINPGLKPTLDRIARILELSLNRVVITGHTDDTQSGMRYYPTNWELSAARAASVLRYFVGNNLIESERLEARGYASNQPVTKNISESYRMRNRRVEIVIKQFREGSY